MFGRNAVLKPLFDRPAAEMIDPDFVSGRKLIVNSIFPTLQGEGPFAGQPAIFIRLAGCNLRCHFCDTEFEKGTSMTIDEIVAKVRDLIDTGTINTDLVVLTGGEPLRQQIIPLLAWLDDLGITTQIETAGTVWPPATPIDRRNVEGKILYTNAKIDLGELCSSGAVSIVCSPKTPAIHPEIEKWCEHYKYIIRMGETGVDGLPSKSTQIEGKDGFVYRPDPENVIPTIWVQPCAEYKRQGRDPVHEHAGAWWFYDETWSDRVGPYISAQAARIALDSYCRTELGFDPEDRFDQGTKANMAECVRVAMKHGYRLSLQQHKIVGIE